MYDEIDQYVVRDSGGNVLGRFSSRVEAQDFIQSLIEGNG
jgi:hypothetical protein